MVGLPSGESGERQPHAGRAIGRSLVAGVPSCGGKATPANAAGLADAVRRGVVRRADRGVACCEPPNAGMRCISPHAGDAPDAESQLPKLRSEATDALRARRSADGIAGMGVGVPSGGGVVSSSSSPVPDGAEKTGEDALDAAADAADDDSDDAPGEVSSGQCTSARGRRHDKTPPEIGGR